MRPQPSNGSEDEKLSATLEHIQLRCVRSNMTFASDALRDEAARFRRMKLLIADARTLRVIEEYAAELETRADRMDAENEPSGPDTR